METGPRWNCSVQQEANKARFTGIKVHSSEVGSQSWERRLTGADSLPGQEVGTWAG